MTKSKPSMGALRAQFTAPSALSRTAYPVSYIAVGALNAVDSKLLRINCQTTDDFMHMELTPPAHLLKRHADASANIRDRIERRNAWLARQIGRGPRADA